LQHAAEILHHLLHLCWEIVHRNLSPFAERRHSRNKEQLADLDGLRYGHTTDRLSNVFKRRRLLGRGRKGNRGTNRNQGEAGKTHALLLKCVGEAGEVCWESRRCAALMTELSGRRSRIQRRLLY